VGSVGCLQNGVGISCEDIYVYIVSLLQGTLQGPLSKDAKLIMEAHWNTGHLPGLGKLCKKRPSNERT
jgi:hypothetical protein